MDTKKQKNNIIKILVIFILMSVMMVIKELTEMKFNLEWFKDIDVWINDFFVNTSVFFFMSAFLSNIKNEYLNFGISYVLSVLIGNTIQLDTSSLTATPKLAIPIVLNILSLIVWVWSCYNRGKQKAQKAIIATNREYAQKILHMDNRARSELYNLNQFIKKHPKESQAIDQYGINFVKTFIEDDKAIRKNVKNNATNNTTN